MGKKKHKALFGKKFEVFEKRTLRINFDWDAGRGSQYMIWEQVTDKVTEQFSTVFNPYQEEDIEIDWRDYREVEISNISYTHDDMMERIGRLDWNLLGFTEVRDITDIRKKM